MGPPSPLPLSGPQIVIWVDLNWVEFDCWVKRRTLQDIWREAFYSRTVEARFAGTHFKRTVFQFARRKTQNISY